jgi:hypothetical protein
MWDPLVVVRRQVILWSVPRIICSDIPISRVIWPKCHHGFRSKAEIIAYLLTDVRTGRKRHSAILFLSSDRNTPTSGWRRPGKSDTYSLRIVQIGYYRHRWFTASHGKLGVRIPWSFRLKRSRARHCLSWVRFTTRFKQVTNEMKRNSLPHLTAICGDYQNCTSQNMVLYNVFDLFVKKA